MTSLYKQVRDSLDGQHETFNVSAIVRELTATYGADVDLNNLDPNTYGDIVMRHDRTGADWTVIDTSRDNA